MTIEVIVHKGSYDNGDLDVVGSWPAPSKDSAVVEAANYAWAMSKLGILHTAVAWWNGNPQFQVEVIAVDQVIAAALAKEGQVVAEEHLNLTFIIDEELADLGDA